MATPNMAFADTAATGHFVMTQTLSDNPTPATDGIQVNMPNKTKIQASHTGTLNLPMTPTAARQAHAFKDLAFPLLSIPVSCDNGCTVHFDATKIVATLNNKVALTGTRCPITNLWVVPLCNSPTPDHTATTTEQGHHANSAHHTTTKAELAEFLHAAAAHPVAQTWMAAIENNHCSAWPGLTPESMRKHLPKSHITPKGHMRQQRQGIRSTKNAAPGKPNKKLESKTNETCVRVHAKQEIAIDLTGRLPVKSSRGHQHVMVLCDCDTNAILAEPMRNRSEAEWLRACNLMHEHLVSKGCQPKAIRMDNEVSTKFKNNLTDNDMDHQLVPPHIHRRNIAERAVQTFKDHFTTILCGTDKNFPMHLWCRLMPQAITTLNLLRKSNLQPNMSADEHLNGVFDFNRTPLAALGTRVLLHETPNKRRTWASRAVDGWHIGHAPEHCRCHKTHVPKTRAVRIGSTVEFFPTHQAMPTTSSTDALTQALHTCTQALNGPTPITPNKDSIQQSALRQLTNIFENLATTFAAHEKDVPSPTQPAPTGQLPRVLNTPNGQSPRVQPRRAAKTVQPPRVVTPKSNKEAPSPRVPVNSRAHMTKRCPTRNRAAAAASAIQRQTLHPTHVPSNQALGLGLPAHNHTFSATHSNTTEKPRPAQLAQQTCSSRIRNTSMFGAQAVQHLPPFFITKQTVPTFNGMPFHHMAQAATNPDTGKEIECRDIMKSEKTKDVWNRSFANEFGRLAQGVGDRTKGTNTMHFTQHHNIPWQRRKDMTHGRIVVDCRPQKEEKERTRLTVGGDRVNHPGEVATNVSDLITAKLLISSVLTEPTGRHCVLDIKNFYLNTPLERPEHMRMKLSIIPQEIIEQCNLHSLVRNGWVHIRIDKGMHGLPQAGILANKLLQKRLALHQIRPCKFTPGLWKHDTKPIKFTLVVDDFGVKHNNKSDLQDLIRILQKDCEMTIDKTGQRCCGTELDWDHRNRQVHLSMPGYVEEALKLFGHLMPRRHHRAPSRWIAPQCGAKMQMENVDTSEPATATQTNNLQKVLGKFQCHARAVDPTMCHILSVLGSAQAKATQQTMEDMEHFLDHAACNPDASLTLTGCDMTLHVESDAAFLTEPKARSRASGHFYLGNAEGNFQILNAHIHIISKVIKSVVSSAAESELGALFINAGEACAIRTTLHEMGHPQPATRSTTDNTTAHGITHRKTKQKRSKCFNMKWYWVRDRCDEKEFKVVWAPGRTNLGDCASEHHPAKHHEMMRPIILNKLPPGEAFKHLRGCAKTAPAAPRATTSSTRTPVNNNKGASQHAPGGLSHQTQPSKTSHMQKRSGASSPLSHMQKRSGVSSPPSGSKYPHTQKRFSACPHLSGLKHPQALESNHLSNDLKRISTQFMSSLGRLTI